MVFPFVGFLTGQLTANLFTTWSTLLSGVLLALIGIHMLLQDDDGKSPTGRLHPAIIALAVSIDSFSVSVSFGMLQLNKTLFITASGLFSLILAYAALQLKGRLGIKDGKMIRRFAGIALIIMGILSCFR